AAVVVEPAQQLLVGAQLVLVIDVLARQERQQAGPLGSDDVGKTSVAKSLVADKVDRGNLGPVALVDLERDIDASAIDGNQTRVDRGVATADGGVGVADGLNVSLDD